MNERILKELNNGQTTNPFISHCSKSKPAPYSKRTREILNAMMTSGLPKPELRNSKLQNANEYSKNRQMRYFGAWTLDQWDYAAQILRTDKLAPLDEATIEKWKDDFISLYHDDFDNGTAYRYIDDWYSSFPKGGYFNPIRFKSLYGDELAIAHRVEEHIQCGYGTPAIAGLMSYADKSNFDHAFVHGGGAYVVTFNPNSKIKDILQSQVDDIDDYIADELGEDESINNKNRIFVTDCRMLNNGKETCAVIYNGFDTDAEYTLAACAKGAILNVIPMDYWKVSQFEISTNPFKVTKGEIDLAKKYLQTTTYETYNDIIRSSNLKQNETLNNETLNDNLMTKEEFENAETEYRSIDQSFNFI